MKESSFLPYLLILPEKNHGILAGEYGRGNAAIRVEANRLFKKLNPLHRGDFYLLASGLQHSIKCYNHDNQEKNFSVPRHF